MSVSEYVPLPVDAFVARPVCGDDGDGAPAEFAGDVVFAGGNGPAQAHVRVGRDCVLRGDIARIVVGTCVVVGDGTIVRPPQRCDWRGTAAAVAEVRIGDFTLFGRGCVVEATDVGSCVIVEDGCVLEPGCSLASGVRLLRGAVVARGQRLALRGVYAGNPAILLHTAPPSIDVDHREIVLATLRSIAPKCS